jgi:hypothetical protein
MKGETYLYFSDGLTGTANDTGAFKSSDFLGAEIASVSTVNLKFKAGEKYNTKAAVVTLKCNANLGTSNPLKFNNICQTISGLLNSSNNMVVVADDANSIYIEPFMSSTGVDDVA